MNELKGKVKVINAKEQISDKFAIRKFVVETSEERPQTIEFQMTQDKCDQLDSVSIGQDVVVNYNLRGREWTNPQGVVKYFNTLEAFSIIVSKF